MIDEHDIYRLFPRKGFEGFALSAIRVAMRSTSPELLYEITRRYSEAWRGLPLDDCEFAYHWFQRKGYLDDPATWPRRGYLQPDQPVYGAIDAARNKGTPDMKLEAQTMRRI